MTSVLSSDAERSSDGEHAADLGVGVGEEAGEDLLLAGVHAPLVGRRASSQACDPLGRSVSTVPGGHDARSPAGGRRPPARQRVPALVEAAPVGLDPLGGHVVRRVHGAEREVEEERLARRRLLLVLHHADGLVGQVLAQVVARPRAGAAARCSGCRRPGWGSSGWCRPAGSRSGARSPRPSGQVSNGPGGRALPAGRQVPLADGQGRVAGVAQERGRGWRPTWGGGSGSRGSPAGCRPGSPCRRRGGCAR